MWVSGFSVLWVMGLWREREEREGLGTYNTQEFILHMGAWARVRMGAGAHTRGCVFTRVDACLSLGACKCAGVSVSVSAHAHRLGWIGAAGGVVGWPIL